MYMFIHRMYVTRWWWTQCNRHINFYHTTSYTLELAKQKNKLHVYLTKIAIWVKSLSEISFLVKALPSHIWNCIRNFIYGREMNTIFINIWINSHSQSIMWIFPRWGHCGNQHELSCRTNTNEKCIILYIAVR